MNMKLKSIIVKKKERKFKSINGFLSNFLKSPNEVHITLQHASNCRKKTFSRGHEYGLLLRIVCATMRMPRNI